MSPRSTYRPDGRGAGSIEGDLAAAAAESPLPESLQDTDIATWADLLFSEGTLRDPAEASQTLLLAFTRMQAGLVRHFDELPARARDFYLQQRLGIRRLPPVADRIVLVVDGDPKRLPATLPRGSVAKAGTGPLGDRLYETVEALTVLGARVLGAHGERVLRRIDGVATGDVAVRRAAELGSAPATPYAPFGESGDPTAPHEVYVASDDLLFTHGGTATLVFESAGFSAAVTPGADVAAFLRSLVWEVSTAEGYVEAQPDATRNVAGGIAIDLHVTGATAPLPLAGAPAIHVRGRFPDPPPAGFTPDHALAFRFSDVALSTSAAGVPAEAGFANEALLDLTKEFEPFGPAPRRNDAFYLKADAVFSKALASIEVELEGEGAGMDVVTSPWDSTAPHGTRRPRKKKGGGRGSRPTRGVAWERRGADGWHELDLDTGLEPLGDEPTNADPLSVESVVGGVPGRYVRARLERADFGWDRFEAQMLHNATVLAKTAANEANPGTLQAPTRPVTPVLSAVRISFTSVERSTRDAGGPRVFRRNGLETPVEVTTEPLVVPYQRHEVDGTLTVGLEPVPEGELVSVYFDLAESSGCDPPPDDAEFAWEYLGAADTWRLLEAVDGTLGLRQSGIVRFAAPLDWALGAPSVDEPAGRWLRARSTAPGACGAVRGIRTDAVEARYRFPAGAELVDETPATRLEAGKAAKLRVSVPGVKKVTNPQPSVGGRGPEPDASFFDRAAAVLRHRNRAVNPWDLEQLVVHAFPEVALCRCLPHHSRDSECAPGWAALVVVPQSPDRLPAPTVLLGSDIETYVRERGTPHLRPVVLCPAYVEVSVTATVHLQRGLPAGAAIRDVERHLRAFLHPLGLSPPLAEVDALAIGERAAALLAPRIPEFGRPLYRSTVVALLEAHPTVEYVEDVAFRGEHAGLERIDVDSCRGLVASALVHALRPQAVL